MHPSTKGDTVPLVYATAEELSDGVAYRQVPAVPRLPPARAALARPPARILVHSLVRELEGTGAERRVAGAARESVRSRAGPVYLAHLVSHLPKGVQSGLGHRLVHSRPGVARLKRRRRNDGAASRLVSRADSVVVGGLGRRRPFDAAADHGGSGRTKREPRRDETKNASRP